MRPDLAVTTALLLLLGTGVAKAANSVQLAEMGGFLLGNAHRCGVPTDRVEHAGKSDSTPDRRCFLRSDRRSCCQLALCRDLRGGRLSGPRARRVDPTLRGGDLPIRTARASSSASRHELTHLEIGSPLLSLDVHPTAQPSHRSSH